LATDLGEPAWEPPWAAALAGERLDIRFLFLQCPEQLLLDILNL
jgi:hypothetical protein